MGVEEKTANGIQRICTPTTNKVVGEPAQQQWLTEAVVTTLQGSLTLGCLLQLLVMCLNLTIFSRWGKKYT